MKKTTFFASLCLALTYTPTLISQVTIPAADFNVITQDTVTLSVVDPTGIVYPQGGQNQSWDYSSITPQSTAVQGFGPNVSSSPGASLFPNANILLGSTRDQFQRWDMSNLEWHGVYYINQTQPNYDQYSNPRTQCEFPFTYGDTFTDSSVCNLVRPNGTFVQKSLISSEIIGYGELTVPGAYYPEVLLDMYIWDGLTTAPNGGTNDFVDTTYYFWAPGYYFPVFFIQNYYQNNAGTISQFNSVILFQGVTYMDLDELRNLQSNRLSVFPNPASDVINVAGLQSQASYSLIATNGAILQKGILERDVQTVKIGNLPSGNYLLLVEEGGLQSVLNVVKN